MKHGRRTRGAVVALVIALSASTGCGPGGESEYVPPIVAPSAEIALPAEASAEFHVVSYNVFLRPAPINAPDESRCRAVSIGRWLAASNVDVVALQETFEPRASEALFDEANHTFPYRVVRQPGARGAFETSGGLSVLSKWPIESATAMPYDACRGGFSDCVAAKGALHVVLRVARDERVHVVATHLDAGNSEKNRAARAEQMVQLNEFAAGIDTDVGPMILAGDFNVDALGGATEYDVLVETLEVRDAAPVGEPSTVNCRTNILCEEPAPPKRIDYVFTRRGEERLEHDGVRHLPMADDGCGAARYLSDHRAVRTTLQTRF